MYTIKEAATRSGVSVPLLRAWERRYKIVSPTRTASGYRLYDDDALSRLRLMRGLVDDGWTPSEAASAILRGAAPAVPAARRDEAGLPPPTGTSAEDEMISAFVEAASLLDAERLERVLDAMFAAASFERVADDLLLPGLARLGDAWADGRVSVAGEHAASHAALRRLAAAYQAAGLAAPASGAILVGLPPGARHELGALAFATAARRAGLPILYLGPDLPAADWVATAKRTESTLAVVGTPTATDAKAAVRVAQELQRERPTIRIAFGGRAANRAVQSLQRTSDLRAAQADAIALPDGIAASVDAVRAALGARTA